MLKKLYDELTVFFKQTYIKKVALEKVQKQNFLFKNIEQHSLQFFVKTSEAADQNIDSTIVDFSVSYIIGVTYTKSNTHLFVSDISGKLIYHCSTGYLQFKGRDRKFRSNMLNNIRKIFLTKFKSLKDKRVALHLKNVGKKSLISIVQKLKDLVFIVTIRNFTALSYNGCRARKVSRKKYKKKLNQRPTIMQSKKIVDNYNYRKKKAKLKAKKMELKTKKMKNVANEIKN